MRRHTTISRFVIGTVLAVGLVMAPAHGVQAAHPGQQIGQAPLVPFSGTATLTSISADSQVPAKATNDLARSEQTETFAVRDATHWRVDVHTVAPVIDSSDETVVSDGQQVVAYSTLFNRAVRMPAGGALSASLLSTLLGSRGAPLGTTAAQYIQLAKSNPREKVRSLGQATVAGRTADVLQISPLVWTSTGNCTGPADCASKEKGLGSAQMWLDHEHGIVLRYEEHGLPKRYGGPRGYRYIVTSIAFGPGPSDTAIAYVSPVAIAAVPQQPFSQTGGSGPGERFQAPVGFIAIGSPVTRGNALSLRGSGTGDEWLSNGPSYAQGIFRGDSTQGFVYVKERMRALGLPAQLTMGRAQAAGSCRVWTGTFPDGLKWLAMTRGKIAVLVVANKLTPADLVHYAASGICAASIVPPPSATEVRNTALDRLEVEVNITRQILGSVIVSAPSAADKSILKGFDTRLQAFDRTVFAIRHHGDLKAVYGPPGFPAPQRSLFKDTVEALKGEMGAAKYMLAGAEAAVQSADRQTLTQQGTVFDDLIRAVDAMVPA